MNDGAPRCPHGHPVEVRFDERWEQEVVAGRLLKAGWDRWTLHRAPEKCSLCPSGKVLESFKESS